MSDKKPILKISNSEPLDGDHDEESSKLRKIFKML